jgi:hypothetical protein
MYTLPRKKGISSLSQSERPQSKSEVEISRFFWAEKRSMRKVKKHIFPKGITDLTLLALIFVVSITV